MRNMASAFYGVFLRLKNNSSALRRKDPIPCLSVRFAAKEAVAKCLHLAPASGVRWRDIAVLHDQHARPVLQLDGAAAALAGRRKIHISLSHSDAYAIAMAALEA
jgi:holo-[acyl-carrier protein] synthase